MSASEGPAADIRVSLELGRRESVGWTTKLHVPQLTDVEIVAGSTSKPSQEDIAGGLHHPFADHDALSLILERALGRVRLQNRLARFLDLQ